MVTKRCRRCKKDKPIDQFHWSRRTLGERHSRCNFCVGEIGREHYRQNKDKIKVRVALRQRRNVLALKRERGGQCERCGYDRNSGCLAFHHRDPSTKSFNIGTSTKGLQRMRTEADKCDLLCLNCHGELHHPDLDGVFFQ